MTTTTTTTKNQTKNQTNKQTKNQTNKQTKNQTNKEPNKQTTTTTITIAVTQLCFFVILSSVEGLSDIVHPVVFDFQS